MTASASHLFFLWIPADGLLPSQTALFVCRSLFSQDACWQLVWRVIYLLQWSDQWTSASKAPDRFSFQNISWAAWWLLLTHWCVTWKQRTNIYLCLVRWSLFLSFPPRAKPQQPRQTDLPFTYLCLQQSNSASGPALMSRLLSLVLLLELIGTHPRRPAVRRCSCQGMFVSRKGRWPAYGGHWAYSCLRTGPHAQSRSAPGSKHLQRDDSGTTCHRPSIFVLPVADGQPLRTNYVMRWQRVSLVH